MQNSVFTPHLLSLIEKNVLDHLNKQARNLVADISINSPRAVGDAVEEYLSLHLPEMFPENVLRKFEKGFERRSMEDMAFYDIYDNYFAVDVKTHNEQTVFNMPNLISVKRLAKFYQNDTNTFLILIVKYRPDGHELNFTDCHFQPIEHLDWDCLTIGALGWGQIQIANSNTITIAAEQTRREWMLHLCDRLDYFYDTEIGKIGERKVWFNGIRNFWLTHN